jgi:hypothetical protein
MEPIRLWRWEHNQREFFAPLSDDERPYLHKAKTPLGATEYRALPRADFDALVKRAENADVAYRAIGAERDKWERLATVLGVAKNKAEALLREARAYLVAQGPFDERERSHLVRRIDAHLERKA